jgi:hypothetical protein
MHRCSISGGQRVADLSQSPTRWPGIITVRLGTALGMMGNTEASTTQRLSVYRTAFLIDHGVWIVLGPVGIVPQREPPSGMALRKVKMRRHGELHVVGLRRSRRSKARPDRDARIASDHASARGAPTGSAAPQHGPMLERQRRVPSCRVRARRWALVMGAEQPAVQQPGARLAGVGLRIAGVIHLLLGRPSVHPVIS